MPHAPPAPGPAAQGSAFTVLRESPIFRATRRAGCALPPALCADPHEPDPFSASSCRGTPRLGCQVDAVPTGFWITFRPARSRAGACRTYGPALAVRASRSEQEPRCASLMRSAAPAGEGAGRQIETSTSAEHARRRCDLCCRRPRAGRRGVKVERWAVNQNDTSTCLHDWQLSPVVGAQPGAPRGRRGRRARVGVR